MLLLVLLFVLSTFKILLFKGIYFVFLILLRSTEKQYIKNKNGFHDNIIEYIYIAWLDYRHF